MVSAFEVEWVNERDLPARTGTIFTDQTASISMPSFCSLRLFVVRD